MSGRWNKYCSLHISASSVHSSPNARGATGSESAPAGLSSEEDEKKKKKKKVFDSYIFRIRRRSGSEIAPVCSSLCSHPKGKKGAAHSRPIAALVLRDSALVSYQLQFSRCRRAPLHADTVTHRVFQLPRPARRHDCLIGSSYFRGNYYHSDYVNHPGSLLLRVAPNSSSSSSSSFISPPRV